MIFNFGSVLGLSSWEDYSYFATILAAVINAVFLGVLIYQVVLGRKALQEAERAGDAANHSIREATRARIDSRAPRVFAVMEDPGVYVLKSNESTNFVPSTVTVPKMNESDLYLIAEGRLKNEGHSSARITLNGAARFQSTKDEDNEDFDLPLKSSFESRILGPGESVEIVWIESHKVSEWIDAYSNPSPPNPQGALFLEIIASDFMNEGVVDHLYLEMGGRPLVPVGNNLGKWKLNKQHEVGITIYPVSRTYRGENDIEVKLPWSETYK